MAMILRAAANSASVSIFLSKQVVGIRAAQRLLVIFWKIASVLVVVWLWLFASLPWPGVGAFAGSS